MPDDRLLVETDAPYLTPQVVRKERNQPAYVAHTARFVAERRGVDLRGARARRRRATPPAVRVVSATTSRPSRACAGCAQFGVRPKRDLGQNFLIDSNILGVIERAAELDPADVVLEIGGGLGVLSEHLAPRVRPRPRRRARPRARARARGRARPIRQHDAARRRRDGRSTSRALDPAPTKVVANLPYGIAAGAILRTIEELAGVTRWVAMVQQRGRRALRGRARARRLRRAVGARAARLRRARACAPVARTVFHPVPNVDSVLVVLERARPGAAAGAPRARPGRVRAPAQGAAALARARAGAGPACATAPARRSSRSAIPPTRAPSGSRPTTSARSAEALR